MLTDHLRHLDQGPRTYHGESREIQMQQYQIAASMVEDEIRQSGFEIISRDDRFIDRPATERPGECPSTLILRKEIIRRKSFGLNKLPRMDSNDDKVIQSPIHSLNRGEVGSCQRFSRRNRFGKQWKRQ
jgi:hypothetical protein